MKIFLKRDYPMGGLEFSLAEKSLDGIWSVALPPPLTEIPTASVIPSTGFMDYEDAEELAQTLLDMGIRPREVNSANLSVMDAHLKDMRKIAFHKLGIPKD